MHIRRALARIDVRLAVLLAGVTAAFSSLLLYGLLAYAVKESLEEQRATVSELIASIEDATARHVDVGTLHRGAAYRVRDGAGHDVAAGGVWPPDALVRRNADLRTALFAGKADYLVGERRDSTGTVVAVAWPLHDFVRERGELTTRATIVVLIGLLGSVALGVFSARRALRPVRETTSAIRAIDPRRLDMRIPVRGTA